MEDGLLRAIDEERAWRLAARKGEGGTAAWFDACLRRHAPAGGRDRIAAARDFALGLDYAHRGLSKPAYLAHPLRVAGLALALDRPPQVETAVIALLHNVFEVTDVAPERVARSFGAPAAAAIADLTVDRGRRDDAYKAEYYGRLGAGPRAARAVKVLDKLDNLFLLCLNPDEAVRAAYLDEIETWVLPMARAELPAIEGYMIDLVADCRARGHMAMAEAPA